MALLSQGLNGSNKTPPMPISVLYLNYSMEMGGIETLICEFVYRLNSGEFLPSVCVLKGGGSLEKKLKEEGIPIYCLEKKEGFDLAIIPRLRRLLKEKDIKILHTHNYSSWLYGIIAALGIKGLRHVHTEHSNVERKRRAFAERMLSYFTDSIICVSEDVKRSMVEKQGISSHRISVVYNGVDTERFYPDYVKRNVYRDKLGIKQDAPVIGIVARLTPIKDHKTLLKAFSKFLNNIPEAILLIVGDGELRDKLKNEATGLSLNSNVVFLGERKDIPDLLNVMDVFVLSSLNEGHNIALLEAMSTALPVVATNVGGSREVVLDGITGYLISPEDPQAISNKLTHIIKDKICLSEMGRITRERIVTVFSIKTMMENYKKLYLELYEKN